MTMAANTAEMKFLAGQNAQQKFQAGSLLASLDNWTTGIATAMNTPAGAGDVDSIAQRTVYNFIPIGRELLALSISNQDGANQIADYLFKCCAGIEAAVMSGRISAAQNTALFNLYNLLTVWG